MPGPARKPLTDRQAQILTEAATGDTLAAIAARLDITREQVGSHLARAYERLDVTYLPRNERRAAAIRVAVRRGLIQIPDQQQEHAA